MFRKAYVLYGYMGDIHAIFPVKDFRGASLLREKAAYYNQYLEQIEFEDKELSAPEVAQEIKSHNGDAP